jgi:hypothetical protein
MKKKGNISFYQSDWSVGSGFRPMNLQKQCFAQYALNLTKTGSVQARMHLSRGQQMSNYRLLPTVSLAVFIGKMKWKMNIVMIIGVNMIISMMY